MEIDTAPHVSSASGTDRSATFGHTLISPLDSSPISLFVEVSTPNPEPMSKEDKNTMLDYN